MDAFYAVARERAMRRLVEDSREIEVQLTANMGCRPVVSILLRLRDEAAESLCDLAEADAEDPRVIRTLQNKVRQFQDFLRVLKQIFLEGIEEDERLKNISGREMEELRGLVMKGDDDRAADALERETEDYDD